MKNDTREYIIECLVRLLIKTDIEDKQRGKERYVKKTAIYKDLIKFFKEFDIVKRG